MRNTAMVQSTGDKTRMALQMWCSGVVGDGYVMHLSPFAWGRRAVALLLVPKGKLRSLKHQISWVI